MKSTDDYEPLRYASYRSKRKKKRESALIKLTIKQREDKKTQQELRRRVNAILNGNFDPKIKAWWNNVVRESADRKKSCLMKRFLGRVRHADVGGMSAELLSCFRSLEHDIIDAIRDKGDKFLKKCRGANNEGLSLGCTFVPGHKKIYKRSPFQRCEPVLIEELKNLLSVVFEDAFGMEHWYKELKRKVKEAVFAIHGHDGLDCLFGGLPISCVWLALKPQCNQEHVDVNAGPATFVMTTSNCSGGDLVISSPIDNRKRKIHLKPGQILGGSWALYKHFNMRVGGNAPDGSEGDRHSWVFYLNRNILNIGGWSVVDC